MKHLINIESLSTEDIIGIYNRAAEFEKGIRKSNHENANVCNMFFENSTRTKLSFEMAQNRLRARKYDFCARYSSINKGEDLYDTINNLSAIGIDTVVMRHCDNDIISNLSNEQYFREVSFINAGSGTKSHPTQALLDFYTIKKHFLDIKDKIIVITGDIAHSRVARSNIALLKKFKVKIRCLAPENLQGEHIEGVEYYSELPKAFEGADVVMALRIQNERLKEKIDIDKYIENYRITVDNLPYAALLMHPGPVNKNVEIEQEVLKTKNARTILEQAKNGVFIRMAVMDMIFAAKGL